MGSIVTNTFRSAMASAMASTGDNIYLAVGRRDAWTDDANPPLPNDDDTYKRNTINDIICAYNIRKENIKLCIDNFEWINGTIYNSYSPEITNSVDGKRNYQSVTGIDSPDFVIASGKIYRCLNNNNGIASTVSPSTGTVNGSENIILSDGYQWKYIGDVTNDSRFITSDYIAIDNHRLNAGDISTVKVTNGGTGYVNGDTVTFSPTVGGTDATGTLIIESGEIKAIVINDFGNGYTEAPTVTINTSTGSGAAFDVVLSPLGGHGSDIFSELNAKTMLLYGDVNDASNELIIESPTVNSYRQLSILRNPRMNNTLLTDNIIVGKASNKYNNGTFSKITDTDVMYISNVSPINHTANVVDNVKIAIEVE